MLKELILRQQNFEDITVKGVLILVSAYIVRLSVTSNTVIREILFPRKIKKGLFCNLLEK